MFVIGLTALVGLALVAFFVTMFVHLGCKSTGREALLPLSDEKIAYGGKPPHATDRK